MTLDEQLQAVRTAAKAFEDALNAVPRGLKVNLYHAEEMVCEALDGSRKYTQTPFRIRVVYEPRAEPIAVFPSAPFL